MVRKANKKETTAEKKENSLKLNKDEVIFGLDIGTRTIVGIAGIKENDKLKVIATEVVGHKNRAMIDGQIHDISLVADVVREVKTKLEEKLGVTLKKVAIAAAGRVLKTYSVKVERVLEYNSEITQDIINSLELEAVQSAQAELEDEIKDEEKSTFYCVGYSVISYFLNGYLISSLLGHKGKAVGIEVVATFLPHMVIDSLYTVMNRVGLEVTNLTLEPIAAINVCIPPNLRLLNLALVDVGAGTSDIAITKDGAVVSFSMVQVAGDEITEKIAHNYLVDFNTAETIKLSVEDTTEDAVTFTDVLGVVRNVSKSEILDSIKQTVAVLGETIAVKIMESNKKAPNAVFCVGGGSQIVGLTDAIADRLSIPRDRVAVRGRSIVQDIDYTEEKLSGPESITPFGIAITSMMQKNADFLSVSLNGKKIRLFNSKKLSVADALILDGFDPKNLIGRTGKSITFEINGEKRSIRGEHGRPAEITVNGSSANMETSLTPGDVIEVIPAIDGTPAKVAVRDIVDMSERKIMYSKLKIDITTHVCVNDNQATGDTVIHEGDKVKIEEIRTAADLAKSMEMNIDRYSFKVNGNNVDSEYVLKDGDTIEFTETFSRIFYEQVDAISSSVNQYKGYYTEDSYIIKAEEQEEEKITYSDLNKDIKAEIKSDDIFTEDDYGISVSVNGKRLTINGNKQDYYFVDIFNSIQLDTNRAKSGTLTLKLNGRPAAYTDKIKTGDNIEVVWENN